MPDSAALKAADKPETRAFLQKGLLQGFQYKVSRHSLPLQCPACPILVPTTIEHIAQQLSCRFASKAGRSQTDVCDKDLLRRRPHWTCRCWPPPVAAAAVSTTTWLRRSARCSAAPWRRCSTEACSTRCGRALPAVAAPPAAALVALPALTAPVMPPRSGTRWSWRWKRFPRAASCWSMLVSRSRDSLETLNRIWRVFRVHRHVHDRMFLAVSAWSGLAGRTSIERIEGTMISCGSSNAQESQWRMISCRRSTAKHSAASAAMCRCCRNDHHSLKLSLMMLSVCVQSVLSSLCSEF